ncbi:DUF1501 domain-containing protein [Chitinimonas sp.]|uniref:DUF1501 domain-containing protein n=1 Tax=Chitinimonas sp. TaxID=1934313 RepID=UPI002F9572DD
MKPDTLWSRRRFLGGLGGLALSSQTAWLQALAAPLTGGDYRALVCVFLYGGNDSNNMLVPTDSAGYAAYQTARGSLALAQASLTPLNGSNFGLHPSLAALADIWNQGKLALQFNVGTLLKPMSKADYLASLASRPLNLFSHSDQQLQWQSAVYNQPSATGWAGRIADLQGSAAVPPVVSVAGNALFGAGANTASLSVPASGSFVIRGFGNTPASNPAFQAYTQLLAAGNSNAELAAAAQVMQQGLSASASLNPVLTGTSSVASLFAGQTGSLAQQLLQVAKMIEARNSIGATRHIFFVSLGGFDTHADQLNRQDALFKQLGPALKAFYDATVQLGVANNVTTFTASDFTRTLQPASGGGSDHAWGGHHLVFGGAVKGGSYGTFPQLVLAGPDDVTSEGRWLPTTSVDQLGATLARWYGVSEGDLGKVFPNLAAFSKTNMGYFG